MKRLLLFFAAVLSALTVHASTITGYMTNVIGAPVSPFIRFIPQSTRINGTNGITIGLPVTAYSTNGFFSVWLRGGPYNVDFGSGLPLVPILVPINDGNTYDFSVPAQLAANAQLFDMTNLVVVVTNGAGFTNVNGDIVGFTTNNSFSAQGLLKVTNAVQAILAISNANWVTLAQLQNATNGMFNLTNGYVGKEITNNAVTVGQLQNATNGIYNITNGFVDKSITNNALTVGQFNTGTNGFVDKSITNNAVTIGQYTAGTNGFVDKNITNGLASQQYVQQQTNGFVDKSITNNAVTVGQYQAGTNGFVDKSITNNAATIGQLNSASNVVVGLIPPAGVSLTTATNVADAEITRVAAPFTNGFVDKSITNNALTVGQFNTGTNGFVDKSITNNAVTIGQYTAGTNGFVDKSITNNAATIALLNVVSNILAGLDTGGGGGGISLTTATNVADAEAVKYTNGFVDKSITNNALTVGQFNTGTNGFVDKSITNNAVTIGQYEAGTNGFVDKSITNNAVTVGQYEAGTNGFVDQSITNNAATVGQLNTKLSTNAGTSWNQISITAFISNGVVVQTFTNMLGPNPYLYSLTNYLRLSGMPGSMSWLGVGAYEYRSALNAWTNIHNGAWVTAVAGGFNINSNQSTIYSITGSSVTGVYNPTIGLPGNVTVTIAGPFDFSGLFPTNLSAAYLVGTGSNNTSGTANAATNLLSGAGLTNVVIVGQYVGLAASVQLESNNTTFLFPTITNSYNFGWYPFETLVLPDSSTNTIQGAASGPLFCPQNFTVQGKRSAILNFDTNAFYATNFDTFQGFTMVSTNLWTGGVPVQSASAIYIPGNGTNILVNGVGITNWGWGIAQNPSGSTTTLTVDSCDMLTGQRPIFTFGLNGTTTTIRNSRFYRLWNTNQTLGGGATVSVSGSSGQSNPQSNYIDNCIITVDAGGATNGLEYLGIDSLHAYIHIANTIIRIINTNNIATLATGGGGSAAAVNFEGCIGMDVDSSIPFSSINFNGVSSGYLTYSSSDDGKLGTSELVISNGPGISVGTNWFVDVPSGSLFTFDNTTNVFTTSLFTNHFAGLVPSQGIAFDFSSLALGLTNGVNFTNTSGVSVTFSASPGDQLWVTNNANLNAKVLMCSNANLPMIVSNVGSSPITFAVGSWQAVTNFSNPGYFPNTSMAITNEDFTLTNTAFLAEGTWFSDITNINRILVIKSGAGTKLTGLSNFWCANAVPGFRQKLVTVSFTGQTNAYTTNQLPLAGQFAPWVTNDATYTNLYYSVNNGAGITNIKVMTVP